METETLTPVQVPGRISGNPCTYNFTRADLQAIVQQAYDRHGVVAQLWTDSTANADRAQSGCNGTYHCPSTGSHHFDCYAVQA